MKPPFSCACIAKLGEILHCGDRHYTCVKYHCLFTQQKTIKLLIDIKNADFDKMEGCLHVIEQDNPVAVRMVWELFKQYQEMGPESLQCGYCKRSSNINIKHLSVNLWRHGIISDKLFEAISTSCLDQESQDMLTKDLKNEMKRYDTKDHIVIAISDTLDNYGSIDENIKDETKRLMKDANFEFSCVCPKRYFDIPRQANSSESTDCLETDANPSDAVETPYTKTDEHKKQRNKSRSTSGSRRKSLPHQDKDQQSNGKSTTKQRPSGRELERHTRWPPDSCKTITVDKKKSRVINIHNTGQGPVNVGNKFVKVGPSDTSDDTESRRSTPCDSESDTGNSMISTIHEESRERINVTAESGHSCKFALHYRPEFMIQTSRRRRTVSESAISNATNFEDTDTTQYKSQYFGVDEKYTKWQ